MDDKTPTPEPGAPQQDPSVKRDAGAGAAPQAALPAAAPSTDMSGSVRSERTASGPVPPAGAGVAAAAASESPVDLPQALPPGTVRARVAPRFHWSPWVVWLIPVMAALIGGWIVLHAVLSRGPTITIRFKNAEGLEAGKTKIKYKEVDIGDVKSISLSRDRSEVLVTAQLTKGASSFLHEDTRFWVVRPRIGAGGISGLGTLLSGSYIGVDVGKSEEETSEFVGLDKPPFIVTGLPGRQFVLHTPQIGSLNIGSPIYFRRLEVGQVVAIELDKNGKRVTLTIFVNAPYDQYVLRNSLFWQASGVDLKLDADGVTVHAESLVSIVAGGIGFQSPPEEASTVAAAAPENASFTLFSSRDKALQHPDTKVRKILMYFNESVRGLAPGAPVDFRGIVIGEVRALSLEYDPKTRIYRFPVEINLYPERLNTRYRSGAIKAEIDADDGRAVLDRLVEHGLRGQLKTGNLVTGMLYIALDFFPEAPKRKIDWKQEPIVIATVPGTLDALQASLSSIAKKIDRLPLDALTADMRRALASLNTTLQSTDRLVNQFDQGVAPEARATLAQVRKTVASADQTLAADSPLQQDLRDTLTEIRRAAQALRSLTDMLDRHPEALIRGKKEDSP